MRTGRQGVSSWDFDVAELKAAAEREEPSLAPIAESHPVDPQLNGALDAAGAPLPPTSLGEVLPVVPTCSALDLASPTWTGCGGSCPHVAPGYGTSSAHCACGSHAALFGAEYGMM